MLESNDFHFANAPLENPEKRGKKMLLGKTTGKDLEQCHPKENRAHIYIAV